MKYRYNPAEVEQEFDTADILLRLNSQSMSYNVRADKFFHESNGLLDTLQKAVAKLEQHTATVDLEK